MCESVTLLRLKNKTPELEDLPASFFISGLGNKNWLLGQRRQQQRVVDEIRTVGLCCSAIGYRNARGSECLNIAKVELIKTLLLMPKF